MDQQRSLLLKGTGLGVLGALGGGALAVPLSVVKSYLMYTGFCEPISYLSDSVWLTPCGLYFFGSLPCCSVAILLTGATLGLLSTLMAARIAAKKERKIRLIWSFVVSMLFVALFFATYFGQ